MCNASSELGLTVGRHARSTRHRALQTRNLTRFSPPSDGGQPDAVVADLGKRWALEQIGLRLWPAASSIQTVITGLFALIKAHDLRPARIASVRVGLSKTVYDMHGTLAWSDKFKALLSTPYVTAIVLHDRRCWLDQFESARFRDPAVDAFARERVKVEIDPRVESAGGLRGRQRRRQIVTASWSSCGTTATRSTGTATTRWPRWRRLPPST